MKNDFAILVIPEIRYTINAVHCVMQCHVEHKVSYYIVYRHLSHTAIAACAIVI